MELPVKTTVALVSASDEVDLTFKFRLPVDYLMNCSPAELSDRCAMSIREAMLRHGDQIGATSPPLIEEEP